MQPVDIHQKGNPRLLIFIPILALMMLTLVITLGWKQFAEIKRYEDQEEHQAQRRILHPGPRGDIFDRNGKLLVGNRPRFSAVIYPDELSKLRRDFHREYIRKVRSIRKAAEAAGENPDMDYNFLRWDARVTVIQEYLDRVNAITGRDETLTVRKLRRHFSQELLLPLTLVNDLEPEEYARLVEQLPPNAPIQVYTDSARYYPHGRSACHVLGYVTSTYLDPDTALSLPGEDLTTFSFKGKVGKAGVERYFDDSLRGTSGGEIYRVDPSGFLHELIEARAPSKGDDLYLSLDIELQRIAESIIGDKVGSAVAVHVKTGEIYVLTSSPGYDLNRLSPYIPTEVYNEITERGAWLNRATQGLYPPGSTFKIITALAALENRVIQPETLIDSPKYFRVGNRLFPCHSPYGFGEINVAKALAVSSNTFFYNIGVQTGVDEIAESAKAFGLDERIPLEIPFNASRMIVPNKQWKRDDGRGGWVPGDTANTSIGQGFLLTTPLHMARFTASLGRGETRTRMTLIRQGSAPGETPVVDHEAEKIPIPPEALDAIYEGMIQAVNVGTARIAQLPDIQVGGKTGTAQVTKDGEALTLAWFVGLAPMEDPELAIAVCIEGTDPNDNFHGGSTAAPVAKAVFRAYFENRFTTVARNPDS